ncbi:MAG: hypothetical protein ACJ786_41995 [Catenulispora sp.]
MNTHFAQDVMDHRHAALLAEAEQSRRYHAARAASAATKTRATPRIGAVRRPFAAMHAWLVAGVL